MKYKISYNDFDWQLSKNASVRAKFLSYVNDYEYRFKKEYSHRLPPAALFEDHWMDYNNSTVLDIEDWIFRFESMNRRFKELQLTSEKYQSNAVLLDEVDFRYFVKVCSYAEADYQKFIDTLKKNEQNVLKHIDKYQNKWYVKLKKWMKKKLSVS